MNVIRKLKNLKNLKACKSWKKPIDIVITRAPWLMSGKHQSAEQEEFWAGDI